MTLERIELPLAADDGHEPVVPTPKIDGLGGEVDADG